MSDAESLEKKVKSARVVVFCLPGRSYSGLFLKQWTEIVVWCLYNNIRPLLSQEYSCNIYYVRNKCLGGNNLAGFDQKPFQGQVDYDDIIWIDSDNIPSPAHVERILSYDLDVVSGYYCMENSQSVAVVKSMNDEFFLKNGHYRFMHINEMSDYKEPFSVDYCGMGLFRTRRGVIEKLNYPWFEPIKREVGTAVDLNMEDVGFCEKLRGAGFRVMVDPSLRVGHEKTKVF